MKHVTVVGSPTRAESDILWDFFDMCGKVEPLLSLGRHFVIWKPLLEQNKPSGGPCNSHRSPH